MRSVTKGFGEITRAMICDLGYRVVHLEDELKERM